MKKGYLLIFGVGWAILLMAYNGVFNKSNDGWVYLSRYTNFELYVDNKSIQRNGRYANVTSLTNYFFVKGDGERSNVTSEIIDCDKRLIGTTRIVSFSEKDGKGKTISDYDYSNEIEWDIITDENTMGRDVFNLVCHNLKP